MGDTVKRRSFLFVDDDAKFLTGIKELFSAMAGGRWDIYSAESHAQALSLLAQKQVDVVVLDIGMPTMDGIHFLQLLARAHPGQPVVMLTGETTEEKRKTCLESGAVQVLEKPLAPDGFAAIFAALDALAAAPPQGGFRGMMRRVGLQEVLQLECLGRKSSVLEIFTGKVRGRIFICEGAIVQAESGSVQGEVALYGLLALRGGEFNLMPYTEPPRRSIVGHWESLLMEAARLNDEGQKFLESDEAEPGAGMPSQFTAGQPGSIPPPQARIAEVILCSGSGEVLYEWETQSLEPRLQLLDQVAQQATQLGELIPVGRFDRLEIQTADGRIVCQVQADRRLFVRRAGSTAAIT
jgi:CheY-like chemotaxis protein